MKSRHQAVLRRRSVSRHPPISRLLQGPHRCVERFSFSKVKHAYCPNMNREVTGLNVATDAHSYAGRFKYDAAAAARYQIKDTRRHTAEMRMIDRAFELIPKKHLVLDLPCGGGRIAEHLIQQGYAVGAADLSPAMLDIARKNLQGKPLLLFVQQEDIEHLTFAKRSFDAIICFRLFHHFPTSATRARAAAELCRVAREFVVISYFSPVSWTSLKRTFQKRLSHKAVKKFATSLAEVRSHFEPQGFRLVKDVAQCRLIHTMHLALFRKIPSGN